MELRKIFGPRRDEVTCEWTKLYDEELRDIHSSPNIIRVTKPRRQKYAYLVARILRREMLTYFWCRKLGSGDNFKDLGEDGVLIT